MFLNCLTLSQFLYENEDIKKLSEVIIVYRRKGWQNSLKRSAYDRVHLERYEIGGCCVFGALSRQRSL